MKRLLVSGGSRGLGLAFCRRYLDQGHAVAAFARSATTEARQLESEHPERFAFFELDVGRDGAPKQAIDTAVDRLGGLDALINNAAVGQDALLAHLSEEAIDEILAINLTATLRLTRQAIRHMLRAGDGGAILTVSSICATRGYPGLAVYAATKGAVEAMTRSLARELGASGIVVNAIAPGFFESDMSHVLGSEQLDSIRRRTPTGRLATPEQVAAACDPLIDPDANITGQVVVVDGGASA